MSKYKWYNHRVARQLRDRSINLSPHTPVSPVVHFDEYRLPEGLIRGAEVRVNLNNSTLAMQYIGRDEYASLSLQFYAVPNDILSVNGYNLPPLNHDGHYIVNLSHNYIRINTYVRNNQFEGQNTGLAGQEAIPFEGTRHAVA